MNILITGVAGFIGSHAAERFNQLGYKVLGIDNFSTYYDVSLKKRNAEVLERQGIKVIRLDLRTDSLIKLLPNEIDYVIHFSGHPGISDTSSFNDYLTNNVNATQNLLNWILELKNKPYFVNISTSSVYGLEATLTEDQATFPASWYGVTKLAAEQLVLSYIRKKELKGTSLRLYSVYGPRERPDKLYTKLLDCGINNKEFPLYEGSEKHLRSYTYVQDIIDGIVSVFGKEEPCNGEIFNLGTEVECTTEQGIQIIEELLNVRIKKKILPPRQGDQLRTKANIDKAKRVLNYNPTIELREGLLEQLNWFKAHKN